MFEGKTVVVTGATKGIGRGLAHGFVKHGAKIVIAVGRNAEDLQSLVNEHPATGHGTRLIPLQYDLATQLEDACVAINQYAPIDILINNAGLGIVGPFETFPIADVSRLMRINFEVPFQLSQAIVNANSTKDAVAAAIVNISSQASLRPLADHAAYCSTKAALDMLTRCLALELGPKGYRVNAVNPTVTMTDMGKVGWSDPQKAQTMLDQIPLRRFAEVEDVVEAVLFLADHKRSAMLNGVLLPVDGGFTSS